MLKPLKGVETHRKQGAFFVPTHIKFSGITPRAIAVIAWRHLSEWFKQRVRGVPLFFIPQLNA